MEALLKLINDIFGGVALVPKVSDTTFEKALNKIKALPKGHPKRNELAKLRQDIRSLSKKIKSTNNELGKPKVWIKNDIS